MKKTVLLCDICDGVVIAVDRVTVRSMTAGEALRADVCQECRDNLMKQLGGIIGGENPNKCKTCGKVFERLGLHMSRMHGVKGNRASRARSKAA